MKRKSALVTVAVIVLAVAVWLRPHPPGPSTEKQDSSPIVSAASPGMTPTSTISPTAAATPSVTTSATESPAQMAGASTAEISPMARERLKTLIQQTRSTLPLVSVIRKKAAGDAHETPPEILESGRSFGELADFLAKNPGLVREALPTYRECALNADVMPAIRGLCTYRLHVYEKEWDAETRAAYGKIPAEIRRLADQLNGT